MSRAARSWGGGSPGSLSLGKSLVFHLSRPPKPPNSPRSLKTYRDLRPQTPDPRIRLQPPQSGQTPGWVASGSVSRLREDLVILGPQTFHLFGQLLIPDARAQASTPWRAEERWRGKAKQGRKGWASSLVRMLNESLETPSWLDQDEHG